MTFQAKLEFSKPQYTDSQLNEFIGSLESHGGWLKANALAVCIGLPASESGKRIVRLIAESIGGAVISGQHGYRLTANATAEEVRHFCRQQMSQAAKMNDRAKDAARIKRIKL